LNISEFIPCALHKFITVNAGPSGIQASGIPIQSSKALKKVYNSYKVNQKQICNANIFAHDVVVPPAIISSIVILPHAGAITVQAS
jgi:hypothetical protein